jgi:hypothetical protein
MGCVRRGKKQKQGPRTLTKEEATGIPSTSERLWPMEAERMARRRYDRLMYVGKMGELAAMTAALAAIQFQGRR